MLYPLAVLIVKVFAREPYKAERIEPYTKPTGSLEDLINRGNTYNRIRNEVYDDSTDSHNGLLHSYLWTMPAHQSKALQGLTQLLDKDGGTIRIYPEEECAPTSIDCLAGWLYAYVVSETKAPHLVKRLARHYLKYCLGIKDVRGKVSARCSNSGLNYCFDGYLKLNQPAFGPAYYTSAALFALAAKESSGLDKLFWKSIYYAHFILMGGWVWWIKPKLNIGYFSGKAIYYANHVTAISLYVLAKANGLDPLTKYAFKDLAFDEPYQNINPWIYVPAIEVGAIDKSYIQKVEDVILTFTFARGFQWQSRPTNRKYFKGEGKRWHHLGSIAYMLKKVKDNLNK